MNYIMTKPKAINCKKLVAFGLFIIAKRISALGTRCIVLLQMRKNERDRGNLNLIFSAVR